MHNCQNFSYTGTLTTELLGEESMYSYRTDWWDPLPLEGPAWSWSYGSCEFESCSWPGVLDTTF